LSFDGRIGQHLFWDSIRPVQQSAIRPSKTYYYIVSKGELPVPISLFARANCSPLFPSFLLAAALPLLLTVSLPSRTSAETLSNNLNAATDYTELISGSQWLGASFGTGNAAYTVIDITLLMQGDSGGTAALDLYSNVNGTPGTLLGTLQAPTGFSSTLTPTSFGGDGLQLSANTTYWAVLLPNSGTTEWAYTDDNTGSGVGFQTNWGISYDAGSGWFTSDTQPMQMRVDADPAGTTPEPASALLLLIGAALAGAGSVRHKFRKAEPARTGRYLS
jgi:hypothetical protein